MVKFIKMIKLWLCGCIGHSHDFIILMNFTIHNAKFFLKYNCVI